MELNEMMRSAAIIGAFYMVPKVGGHLCKRPSANEGQAMLWVRSKCLTIQTKTSTILGDQGWHVCTEVIADNAWISVLAILLLLKSNPKGFSSSSFQTKMALISGFLCFSSASWSVRYGLATVFPSIARYIAPRSFN